MHLASIPTPMESGWGITAVFSVAGGLMLTGAHVRVLTLQRLIMWGGPILVRFVLRGSRFQ